MRSGKKKSKAPFIVVGVLAALFIIGSTSKDEKTPAKSNPAPETSVSTTTTTTEITTTAAAVAPTTAAETTTTTADTPTETTTTTTKTKKTTTKPKPTTTITTTQETTTTTTTTVTTTTEPEKIAMSYVANTNTMKFHNPSCSSVEDIQPGNRWDFTGDRAELIAQDYQPCKRCNP